MDALLGGEECARVVRRGGQRTKELSHTKRITVLYRVVLKNLSKKMPAILGKADYSVLYCFYEKRGRHNKSEACASGRYTSAIGGCRRATWLAAVL